MHSVISGSGKREAVVFFALNVFAVEAMQLEAKCCSEARPRQTTLHYR